jgi:N6-L-threonylcarbamoyladenine synthase
MDVVLGIETSCDETAAGLLADGRDVLSNVVASQDDLHAKFRGVVPEIASRAHIERINLMVREALDRGQVSPRDITAIAATARPGLIGCLLIGLTAGKTLAWAWGKPFVAVDHVQAHALSPTIGLPELPLPAVSLVVSGGHTCLMRLDDCTSFELLGRTRDDAAGEAYDKVASILDLGYPGGPIIDNLAKHGDPKAVHLPRTWLEPDSLDFSFSGLKTAVLYHVHGPGKTSGGLQKLSEQDKADICASFQAAVVDVLVGKTMQAVKKTNVRTVMVGGGVAANSALRSAMQQECDKRGIQLHLAQRTYCTDNGAMIAYLGWHLYKRGMLAPLDVTASATM